MTNTDLLASITLDDLITYAATNYLSAISSSDDIELIDTISLEMRDTLDDLIDELRPSIDFDTLTDADLAPLDELLRSDAFHSRILDIALARLPINQNPAIMNSPDFDLYND